MHFDAQNIESNINSLKDEFQKINDSLTNIESAISTLSSSAKSPAMDYFKSATKSISTNSDILANHFSNITGHLENVKEIYES